MCKKVSCPQCGKASWAGCGAHVEEVLADTPLSERCKCDGGDGSRPAGLFSRLFKK
jgi:hypothetical protein